MGKPVMTKAFLRLLVLPALMAVLLAACGSPTPGVGQVVEGDTLVIRLDDYDRTQEFRYRGCDDKHYFVTPSTQDNELFVAKFTIVNSKARTVFITLDAEASELRGTGPQQTYSPIDVDAVKQETLNPTDDQLQAEKRYARPGHGVRGFRMHCNEWTNRAEVDFLRGSVELRQTPAPSPLPDPPPPKRNPAVAGWVVYEVPIGMVPREIRWGAGDTIYIRFPT